MTDYLTLFGTAINKRPEQLVGIFKRSAKAKLLPRLPVNVDQRYERQIPEDPTAVVVPIRKNTRELQRSTASQRETYRDRAREAAAGTLTFLNESVEFDDGEHVSLDPDRLKRRSLHWKLKCWGFEHLEWSWLGYSEPESLPEDHRRIHRQWLGEWLDGHPIAGELGYLRREWMPHSACLRICNWSRYEAVFGEALSPAFRREIRRFVSKNAAFLADNVEYGVGGNHLIENAIALVLAGVYLDDEEWRRQGRQLFEREASNQFFDDGGHFERSPMYHAIVCQRYLTASSLLREIGEESREISRCATASARFLGRLRPPDGRIPLLNDSVFGEALRLDDCLAYARGVGAIDGSDRSKSEPDSTSVRGGKMDDTGYYWLGDGDDRLLVAAHEIAVPHMPAHAHAHPGQICLWIDGRRVLTDTGVYKYAAGEYRQRARSIRSHNTIQVGEREPVRMASSFWLWGQIDPSVTFEESGSRLELAYSVGGVGRPEYRHRREIEYGSGVWSVEERVESHKSPVVSRLHVHPRLNAKAVDNRVEVMDKSDDPILSVVSFGDDTISIEDAPYYSEYGTECIRDAIAIRPSDSEFFQFQLDLSNTRTRS